MYYMTDGHAIRACRSAPRSWRLGSPFDLADGSSVLDQHPDREIVAIDVERDFDIVRTQIGPRRVVEAQDLTARLDEAAHGVAIARAGLKPIAQVNGADLIL